MIDHTHTKNKTITVRCEANNDDELFVGIYRYGGKLKSIKSKDIIRYITDEQGLYRFSAYREKLHVYNWAVYCMFIRLANIAYQIQEAEEAIR